MLGATNAEPDIITHPLSEGLSFCQLTSYNFYKSQILLW